MDEMQIIKQCQDGRMASYEYLIKNYEIPLYRYCYHLMQNEEDAKDLFQDSWIKVMTKIHLYNPLYPFKNWLYTITTNTFKDYYRRRVKMHERQHIFYNNAYMKDIMEAIQSSDNIEEQAIKDDRALKLQQALLHLKWHYRVVITLYYFQEASIKEISQILKIPIGTVKSRLSQGKMQLAKLLEVVL